MLQDPISAVRTDFVAIHYDGQDGIGWFGPSRWFDRYIRRSEFSLYRTPQLITCDDAKTIRKGIIMYGLGVTTILELRQLK